MPSEGRRCHGEQERGHVETWDQYAQRANQRLAKENVRPVVEAGKRAADAIAITNSSPASRPANSTLIVPTMSAAAMHAPILWLPTSCRNAPSRDRERAPGRPRIRYRGRFAPDRSTANPRPRRPGRLVQAVRAQPRAHCRSAGGAHCSESARPLASGDCRPWLSNVPEAKRVSQVR